MIRIVAVAALVFLVGCGPTAPDEPANVEGDVIAVDTKLGSSTPDDRTLIMKIWVKESPAERCGLIHSIRTNTRLLTTAGGKTQLTTAADLRVGLRVRVWFGGIVLDSCPGQAGADVVEILR